MPNARIYGEKGIPGPLANEWSKNIFVTLTPRLLRVEGRGKAFSSFIQGGVQGLLLSVTGERGGKIFLNNRPVRSVHAHIREKVEFRKRKVVTK